MDDCKFCDAMSCDGCPVLEIEEDGMDIWDDDVRAWGYDGDCD